MSDHAYQTAPHLQQTRPRSFVLTTATRARLSMYPHWNKTRRGESNRSNSDPQSIAAAIVPRHSQLLPIRTFCEAPLMRAGYPGSTVSERRPFENRRTFPIGHFHVGVAENLVPPSAVSLEHGPSCGTLMMDSRPEMFVENIMAVK